MELRVDIVGADLGWCDFEAAFTQGAQKPKGDGGFSGPGEGGGNYQSFLRPGGLRHRRMRHVLVLTAVMGAIIV